jgi:hypothetical protein
VAAIRFLRLQAKDSNQSLHCSDRPAIPPDRSSRI